MYQVQNSQAILRAHRRLLSRGGVAAPVVGRTVLLLGLTSLFTDISSEMVSTILPLFLVYTLGLTPFQFGMLDGLYQGGAAVARVVSGFVGDRWSRHKQVAAVGYGLSAFCKLGFLAFGGVSGLAAIIALDRTGKGIRTAPRDALISLSTRRADLGVAFGVHRALDTSGALIGPLLAFALLAVAPDRFDAIFVVSFFFALVGFGILTLFVDNRTESVEAPRLEAAEEEERPRVTVRRAAGLLEDGRFRLLVAVGTALGFVTMSDGFVYLALQRRLDFEMRLLPLLYVATAFVYMLLAVPFGRLADRVGRGRVFVGGYALLLLLYASLLAPRMDAIAVVACVLLFGAYYAATDGVLMALGSAILPDDLRGSGLAVLTTGTNIAKLLASIAFGAVWTLAGLQTAVVAFAAGLVVAMALAAFLLARAPRSAQHA
jgi:MFS family permease